MATIDFKLDLDKAREAIVYLASKRPGLSKYEVCKLIFLADKYHLVRYGRTITGDRYVAMNHGPVPSGVLDVLNKILQDPNGEPLLASTVSVDRSFQNPQFSASLPLEFDNLSLSDIEALDETLARYGKKQFSELRALTHEMVAYQKAWEKRGRNNKSAPMAFEDFFEEDSDAIAGVMEEAIEDSSFRKAFSAI